MWPRRIISLRFYLNFSSYLWLFSLKAFLPCTDPVRSGMKKIIIIMMLRLLKWNLDRDKARYTAVICYDSKRGREGKRKASRMNGREPDARFHYQNPGHFINRNTLNFVMTYTRNIGKRFVSSFSISKSSSSFRDTLLSDFLIHVF